MYRQRGCVTYNIDLHSYVTKLHSFGPIPARVLHAQLYGIWPLTLKNLTSPCTNHSTYLYSKSYWWNLPNFIKRKHPRKGEKQKERAWTKVQASKQPKRGGQNEPASMTAPVGRSVHRMGCVFHLPPHPTLTNILPQSIFLPADFLTHVLHQFFFNPDLPYHPPT